MSGGLRYSRTDSQSPWREGAMARRAGQWGVLACGVARRLILGAGSGRGAEHRAGDARSARASRIGDQYKWNLADLYPSDAAWRAEKDALAADARAGQGVCRHAGAVGVAAGQGAGRAGRAGEDAGAAVRLREPGGRPGHAGRHLPGHERRDDAGGGPVRRRLGVCRAGTADARSEDARVVDCRHAGAEAVHLRVARRVAAQGPHAERARRGAAGADAADGHRRRRDISRHLPQRGPAVAHGEAGVGHRGAARRRRVLRGPGRGRPRRPPQGDGGLLRRARQLSPDDREHAEHRRAGRVVPDAGAQLRVHGAARARRPEHPAVGLHRAGRRA